MKQKKSITLSKDVIALVKQLSDEQKISFSEYVNEVLRDHIDVEKKKKKTSLK